MTRPAVAIDGTTDHAASSRLPGGGPRSRWSPRRLAPSAWWWTGATLLLALVGALVLLGTLGGRLDPGTGAVLLVGSLLVTMLVFSWTWGTVAQRWRERVGDDVLVVSAGTEVALRVAPVTGDVDAVAAITVAGRPVGMLRERGGRRTLVVDGHVHTLERSSEVEPGSGRRHRTLSVRDRGDRAVATATRFRGPGVPVTDWRIRAGEVDLWLRTRREHEPRRRTLLDDRGRAWLTRPRRTGGDNEAVGATTVLPPELDPVGAAAVAWLLTAVERDGRVRPVLGGGATDDATGATDDVWPWDSGDTGGGSGADTGGGGDSWW